VKDALGISREQFIAAVAALSATVGPIAAHAQEAAPSPPPSPSRRIPNLAGGRLRSSLVLSGGGALGAYEAGIVQALVEAAGVGEGQPLPQYGVVAGTSIGALNSYLVATAQWGKLRDLWSTIASQNVIRLKPEFAKLTNPASGIGTRIVKAISLALGFFSNVQGVLDGDYLQTWLQQYFDLTRPIVTPLIWAVTNLNLESPQYFYLIPPTFSQDKIDFALTAMQRAVGPDVPLQQAHHNDLLVKQLRASAAVPLAFDPVILPGPDGNPAPFVDGGVTANTPIGIARAVSSAVDAVLLNPVGQPMVYKSALDVSLGTFDTMQRRMMEDTLRIAQLQTTVLQTLENASAAALADVAQRTNLHVDELSAYIKLLSKTTFAVIRPKKDLPLSLFGFDDAKGIAETYQAGYDDGKRGFIPASYDIAS
jgi:predicted acylesterase/phospholipase RssA